jgi:hypothetical protein
VLSIFRTNQISVSLLLIFYALLLRSPVLLLDFEWQPTTVGWLVAGLYQLTAPTALSGIAVAFVLLFVGAVLINISVNDFKLNSTINMFPGLFYIFISSTIHPSLYLSPVLVGNFFLLLALMALWGVYKKHDAAASIFNVGFWMAVASLCYPPFLFFLIVAFAGLGSLRAFRIQERLMVLAGAFVPFFLFFVYAFWIGEWQPFLMDHFVHPFDLLAFPRSIAINDGLILLGAGLMTLILILGQNNLLLRKTIDARKRIDLLYWMLFSAGLAVLFVATWSLDHLLTLCIPAGILLSFAMTRLSNKWAEAIHFILLLGLLLLHYQKLLVG